MAVHALRLVRHLGIMISFGIERFGKPEHVAWAILDAILASLAPLLDDDDLPFADLNGVKVQGSPPELHMVHFLTVRITLDFILREELFPLPLRTMGMQ
jgi:hypothetical protein